MDEDSQTTDLIQRRRAMAGQAGKLAWETDVWIAEAPDHLIHFNGEQFLGPYEPA
jgi:hypothetical protein